MRWLAHRADIHTYVLLAQRIHQLREDLVGNNSLREVIGVVGEAAQRERSSLLNARHVVQQQRPEQLHDTGILHGVDVLGPCSGLGYALHELHACLLVLLEDLEQ